MPGMAGPSPSTASRRTPTPGSSQPEPPARGPVTARERSLAPDLARGSVLLFIALANVAIYLYGQPEGYALRPLGGSPADQVGDVLVSWLVDRRSYPMFALLFGYGMVQLLHRQLAGGTAFGRVQRLLVRRSLWLLAFGAAHAFFLFTGDILGLYALLGLIVVLLLKVADRWLLLVAGLSLPLIAGFAALDAATAAFPELFGTATFDAFAVEQENYLLSAAIRLGLWLTAVVGSVTSGFAIGPMLVGVVLARRAVLDRPQENLSLLRRLALGGVGISLIGALPYALVVAEVWSAPWPLAVFLLAPLHTVTGVAGGIGYAALFGLLGAVWAGRPRRGVVGALAATGERSLTSYLLQSVLMAPLLAAWGLGLGDGLGTAAAYSIATAVWLVTVLVATALAARGRRGPAEQLLRRLTYGRTARSPQSAPAGAGSTTG